MIFVTVGAQMPFDRLVRAVDAWAAARNLPDADLFMQIGDGGTPPAHGTWTRRLDGDAFRACLYHASVVVTHAGMGTILTALELGRPVIVMPRRGDLGETRNDHQLDTCVRLQVDRPEIRVARDEGDLSSHLDDLHRVLPSTPVAAHASIELLEALRTFIETGEAPLRTEPGNPTIGRIGPDADHRRASDDDGEQRRAA